MAYLSEFNQFQSKEREHNPPKTALASNTNCVKVLTKITLRFSNSLETIAKLHESCNTNVCVCLVSQSCLNPWNPVDCSLPGSSVLTSYYSYSIQIKACQGMKDVGQTPWEVPSMVLPLSFPNGVMNHVVSWHQYVNMCWEYCQLAKLTWILSRVFIADCSCNVYMTDL